MIVLLIGVIVWRTFVSTLFSKLLSLEPQKRDWIIVTGFIGKSAIDKVSSIAQKFKYDREIAFWPDSNSFLTPQSIDFHLIWFISMQY